MSFNDNRKCNCGINQNYVVRKNLGNYQILQCIRCGDKMTVYRNLLAKKIHEAKLREQSRIKPNVKLFKLLVNIVKNK